MPFPRPTLASLRDQAKAALAARLAGADLTLRRSNLVVTAIVLAGLVNGEYGYLDWIVDNVFLPDSASGAYLERWAAIKRLARESASPAAGSAIFTGTNGVAVPAGALVQTSDQSLQFATQSAATIVSGSATVPIEAVEGSFGASGNLASATALTLIVAFAGLNANATVTAPGLTGGADLESDDALRARLLLKLQQPPQGGAATDYEQWALEALPGVTRAWAYPLNRGPGTIDVTFVMDGRADIIPLTADVDAVQDYIGEIGGAVGIKPVTDDCLVFAPTGTAVDITIHGLAPATSAAQAAVEAALADVFARDAIPGGGLSFQDQLIPAIAAASGVTGFTLVTPSADIAGSPGVLLTLGAVTFT